MELYFKNRDQFLNQKHFKIFINDLTKNSLNQIDNIIKIFNKNYLRNLKKEMVTNLLKYNVDGDWEFRLKESEKYKKASCSLKACIVRYGEKIGKKIYDENIKKVITKKENYTDGEWKILCSKKVSNLGLGGYIKKYGEEDGIKKWDVYFKKWRIGIDKRKKEGWKNGRSLEEYQEKHGIKIGYEKWRKSYDKRNYTLSLKGFIDRFGEENGKNEYHKYIEKMIENCRRGTPYSKISQELFDNIFNKCDANLQSNIRYFTKNGEQKFYADGKFKLNLIFVDFKCGNVIIEFDGTYWHSTPSVKNKDNRRTLFLKSVGYKVLRIKEKDYLQNKNRTVEKCLEFIKENYEKKNS